MPNPLGTDVGYTGALVDSNEGYRMPQTAYGASESGVQEIVEEAVAGLVASAPGALNTLDELAAALGDDASYAGTITTALAGKQPLDSDLTAIAALTTTSFGRSLLESANAGALRALAGTDAVYQPLDSDLTAIAALSTTSFGRGVLEAANAAALRTLAGTDAVYQPSDADLTALAALSTTAFGRSLLEAADAAALRALAGTDALYQPVYSGARVLRTTAVSLADGIETVVTWETEAEGWDVGAYWDAGAPTRLTIPANGRYRVEGQVQWAFDADGYRLAQIRKGGAAGRVLGKNMARCVGVTAIQTVQQVVCEATLAAGDFVELYAQHLAGSALNIEASSSHDLTWVSIHRLS